MWGTILSLIWSLGYPNHMCEREMGSEHIWEWIMPPSSWALELAAKGPLDSGPLNEPSLTASQAAFWGGSSEHQS